MRGIVVEAPRARPPRVGLVLSALPPPDGEDERWTAGVNYLPEGCAWSGRLDPECGPTAEKVIPDNPATVSYKPFVTWAGARCSTMERRVDWGERVTRQLLACEPNQIGAELWRGDTAVAAIAADPGNDENPWLGNRFLASDLAEVVTAGPAEAMRALAALEGYAADCNCGQRAMIHATRQLVSLWDAGGALRREGELVLTVTDNIVVPDGGYDGSGPDGAPAGATQWAYATGMVTVRRQAMRYERREGDGEDQVELAPGLIGGPNAEGVDRATNTMEVRAERIAAATWDGCCHGAVEVDLPAWGALAS